MKVPDLRLTLAHTLLPEAGFIVILNEPLIR
jgi:hypothetical protein